MSNTSTDNLITVLWTVALTGTLGTEKYFLSRHQYTVSGSIDILLDIDPCSDCPKQILKSHWVIAIDSESYYLDKDNAQFEGRVKEDWEMDWNIYMEKKPWEQPRQFRKTYKEVYGIDLALTSQRQDNGYDIWKQMNNKNN